jgi:hypothetical protein
LLRRRWQEPQERQEDLFLVQLIEERQHRVEKDVVRTDRNISIFRQTMDGSIRSYSNDDAMSNQDHGSLAYILGELDLFPHLRRLRDILMTYAMFHIEIGYVQGMSDILAPLYATLVQDRDPEVVESDAQMDALVFYCFLELMIPSRFPLQLSGASLCANFHVNQSGMRTRLILVTYVIRLTDPQFYRALQDMELEMAVPEDEIDAVIGTGATSLLWLFRGILTLFKRELTSDEQPDSPYAGLCRVWDYMFAMRPSMPWIDVWLAVALVHAYIRPRVLLSSEDRLATFEALLAYMNSKELAQQLDPEVILDHVHMVETKFDSIVDRIEKTAKMKVEASDEEEVPSDLMSMLNGFWPVDREFDGDVKALAELESQRGRHHVSQVRISIEQAICMLKRHEDK